MPLKTPKFWQTKGLAARLLWPVSQIYGLCHKIKASLVKPYKSALPVLCVGGAIAGGSGKTPTVHAIIDLIRNEGPFESPVILTRGYGGVLEGPTLVVPEKHSAKDVGDEALLHAAKAPTIVSRDRAAGARLAELMGADVIIMDDGLQNSSLEKTMSVLAMDTSIGIGNGYMIPAGPLREPLADALQKSTAIIHTNGTASLATDKPVLRTTFKVTSSHDMTKKWIAFAGIGYPEKFRQTLQDNGFELAVFKSFPDHHAYTARDLDSLPKTSDVLSYITTAKDWVRLPPSWQDSVEVLDVALSFENPDLMIRLLKSLKAA